MTTTEYCFPKFLPGQVLTDDDLNSLRTDYARRVLEVGTLVGFGVGCGLDLRVEGGRVVVEPGYAVDQEGRLLVLRQPQRLDPRDIARVEFPFIEGQTGITPVLRAREDVEPAPGPCSDQGCERHSDTVCERVEVVLVRGRLQTSETIEAAVRDLEPLRVSNGDRVEGSISALRSGLVRALRGQIGDEALRRLGEIGADERSGAVAVQRVSLLNTVLALTWDLYRCLAWMRLVCFRDDRPAGVALGHVTGTGEARTWDCEPRHHFELSAAIARAILGWRCDDPCTRFRLRIEALITGYREVSIPEPEGPPRDPDPPNVPVCKPVLLRKKYWHYPCDWLELPPPIVEEPDWLPRPDLPIDSTLPGKWTDLLFDEPDVLGPWIRPTDPTHSGLVNLRDALGRPGDVTRPAIEQALAGAGITAPVEVMTLEQAKKLDGYRASSVVAGSDRVVIAVNARGAVIETGSVPTTVGLRGAGPNAARAREEASVAVQEVSEARRDVGTAMDRIGGVSREVETLGGEVAGLLPKVRQEVDGKIGSVRTELLSQVRGEIDTAVKSEVGEVRAELIREKSELSGRIDHLLTGMVTGPGRPGLAAEPAVATNEAVFATLSSLQKAATSMRAEMAPAARRRFDREMAAVEAHLGTIETAARRDRPVLEAEGEAVVAAADALGRALREAGVKGAARREMDDKLRTLGEVVVRR